MNTYLQKHSLYSPLVKEKPVPGMKLCVVIPCHREPALLKTLESLSRGKPTQCKTEVIVVINCGENEEEEIKNQNLETFAEAKKWALNHTNENISYPIINILFSAKHAGVGLARKAGMDEAVSRFEAAGTHHHEGILVCFDADSECDENYLVEIEEHFIQNPDTPGASIYFEHPLEGEYEAAVYEGIIRYELFLRNYVNAMRYAGHPYAFQTIGSSMAVRSDIYQQQGGMNRRKAGEDFYFLQKVIPLGNFSEINTTRVIPSPRPSLRVPFGTGKAIHNWLEKKELLYYDFRVFEELKVLLDSIDTLYSGDPGKTIREMPDAVKYFLTETNFKIKLDEIRRNTTDSPNFRKRFFRWFDGFKTLKYVHFATEHVYPKVGIHQSVCRLPLLHNLPGKNEKELLAELRKHDRDDDFLVKEGR